MFTRIVFASLITFSATVTSIWAMDPMEDVDAVKKQNEMHILKNCADVVDIFIGSPKHLDAIKYKDSLFERSYINSFPETIDQTVPERYKTEIFDSQDFIQIRLTDFNQDNMPAETWSDFFHNSTTRLEKDFPDEPSDSFVAVLSLESPKYLPLFLMHHLVGVVFDKNLFNFSCDTFCAPDLRFLKIALCGVVNFPDFLRDIPSVKEDLGFELICPGTTFISVPEDLTHLLGQDNKIESSFFYPFPKIALAHASPDCGWEKLCAQDERFNIHEGYLIARFMTGENPWDLPPTIYAPFNLDIIQDTLGLFSSHDGDKTTEALHIRTVANKKTMLSYSYDVFSSEGDLSSSEDEFGNHLSDPRLSYCRGSAKLMTSKHSDLPIILEIGEMTPCSQKDFGMFFTHIRSNDSPYLKQEEKNFDLHIICGPYFSKMPKKDEEINLESLINLFFLDAALQLRQRFNLSQVIAPPYLSVENADAVELDDEPLKKINPLDLHTGIDDEVE